MISAENLSFSYADTDPVFTDLSFEADKGDYVTIVGVSGIGKTTLVRCMAGLLQPTNGKILFDGTPPLKMIEQSKFSLLFQGNSLLPWRTAAENVALPLELNARDSGADAISTAIEKLKLLEMEQYSDRFPHQLSGGQKQRIALARTLVTTPSVIFLDEPYDGLDYITRAEVEKILGEEITQHNITVICVTHDLEYASRISDKIIVLTGERQHIISCTKDHLPNGRLETPAQVRVLVDLLGKTHG